MTRRNPPVALEEWRSFANNQVALAEYASQNPNTKL